MDQVSIDSANKTFWRELCGTSLARSVGIEDDSIQSLVKFDEAYLNFYPYLLDVVPVEQLRGCRVLEIGLGYGTLSRILCRNAADYTGLDISDGPVESLRDSFEKFGLPGKAIVGSALNIPFAENSFDYIVSIGCLHHTGRMLKAFEEVHRVLKPGGVAYLMVYNKYSFRQWTRWPIKTLKRFLSEYIGIKWLPDASEKFERRAYDANQKGEAAPATEFISRRQLKRELKRIGFKSITVVSRNSDRISYRGRIFLAREKALNLIGPYLGLDLYIAVEKPTI